MAYNFISDFEIQKNDDDKLTVEANSVSWSHPKDGRNWGVLKSLFEFSGAFDVKVDFDLSGMTRPDDTHTGFGIEVRKATVYGDRKRFYWIKRGYWQSGIDGYGYAGSLEAEQKFSKSMDSGKLRITRTVSRGAPRKITVYYWDGTGWEGFEFAETVTVPLFMRVIFGNDIGSDLTSVISNFTISADDILESTILYQINDSGDLYQINDSGDIYIVGG